MQTFINRHIRAKLSEMLQYFPVVVLSGARQTGKTTILRKMFPDIEYVVFDSVIDLENARRDPDLFLKNHSTPLLLDEIQYAPELVSAIKRHIDRDRKNGQFIITGSQQWGILKNLSESLAGRAVFLDLYPFSVTELANKTGKKSWLEHYLDDPHGFMDKRIQPPRLQKKINDQLYCGWYPEAQNIPVSLISNFYASYIRTYIERDLRATAGVENYQQFGAFYRLAAALSAQEVNSSHFGREIGITPQTASRWIDLMKNTYQWISVPAFSLNTIKRISGKPKGYIADSGIMCASLALSSPQALLHHPSKGAIYETAAVGEIVKLATVIPATPQLHHFRSHGGAEVDLILERDGRYYPIEIKYQSNPTKKETRGIHAFRKTYSDLPIMPGIVLCPCEEIHRITETDIAVPFLG
jgi:uncharacterized protein